MLTLWNSVKHKNLGLSLRTGSGTDTEVGWGMWLEMGVINTLDGGRRKKENPVGIHPSHLFHLMPNMRKHMPDLYPTTAGPAAAFSLALSTS